MVTFRSKIALWIVLFCSVVPTGVQAVTFSVLHVHSRLGEPLSAETLIQFGATEEPERFSVRAAASDVYASAHLEFSDALLGVHYQLEKKDAREYVLRITSQKPMDEPLLITLVEFIWNGGKLLREITFTLDPADYSTGDIHSPAVEARSALSLSSLSGLNLGDRRVVTVPRRDFDSIFDNGMINVAPATDHAAVSPSAPTLATIPPLPPRVSSFSMDALSMDSINVPMPTDQPILEAAPAEPIALQFKDDQGHPLLATSVAPITAQQGGHGQEHSTAQEIFDIPAPKTPLVPAMDLESVKHSIYVVKKPESIYSVARRYQYAGVSTVQMVHALHKANPHLLSKQIMLKAGDVLIIPTRKDVQGLGSKKTIPRPPYVQEFSHHKTAHPFTKNEVKVQRATISYDKAVSSAEDVVANRRVQKNAHAIQDTLDKKIRELEARVDQETVGQAMAPASKMISVPVVPQAIAPTPPRVGTVMSATSLDFMHELISRYGVLCGGLLAVVIALVMVWNHRHRFFTARQSLDVSPKKKVVAATSPFSSSSVFADRSMPVPTPGITMSEIMAEDVASLAPTSAAHPPSVVGPQKKKDQQQPSDVDCIAEAEVYMAYGRLQQAEDLLVDALQKDLSSSQLSMKLLDVLHQQKKVVQFNKLAATFRQTDSGQDPVHWERVVQMGLTLDPKNALYQSVAAKEELQELPPLELSIDDQSVK